jgi:adenylate cyclase
MGASKRSHAGAQSTRSEAAEYRFGSFRLLSGRRQLLLHDAPVRLGSRAFDVLLALVKRQGQLTTKDDLIADVWLGRVVEENNLQAQISAVRKVLAGAADGERYLQTVPGRGYQFVGHVQHERPANEFAGAGIASRKPDAAPLPLPDKPSIAVVPFINLSGDPQQEYFCDGITDDIVTELSRFSELVVIASNSSFKFKGRAFDVRQVGKELGIHYVLEGSIRKLGDKVRITAKLADAITGALRWAEHYDREMRDVFAVQDAVAQTIVTILTAHVGKAEGERALAKPPATWQAYDYYLRGVDVFASFLTSYKAGDLYEARRFLQSALSIDPNYARALAVFSNTHLCGWLHSLDDDYLDDTALERAHKIARKAVQLDPALPIARMHHGLVLTFMGKHQESIAEFEKAIALNSHFATWRFPLALVRAGEPERAIRVMEAISRLDPFYSAAAAGFLGAAYYMLKRYQEALPPLRECTSRAPNYRSGHCWLAASYAQLGQTDEARSEVAEVLRLDPTFTVHGKHRRLARFKCPDDAEHYLGGLLRAGLPEQ